MLASTRTEYGGPEKLSLKEISTPVPKPKEVLIRVHASTINRTDCGALWGKPYLIRAFIGLLKPTLQVPGTDFAGEVVAVGQAVTNFKTGNRVWGFNDQGLASHAEFLTISADDALAIIPENISYQQAVASAEGAHYAYNFINKVALKPGQKVLVNGGTGAIGSAAIQLLKANGIFVTATAATPHLEKVKALGADVVIDYLNEDFTQLNQQFDFVFDAVGKSSFGKCKAILKPGGVYISSELGPGAENLYLPFSTMLSTKKVMFPLPVNCKRSVLFLNHLLAQGKFNPLIDKTFLPTQIAEAYTYVVSGEKIGNVIVNWEHR